MQSKWDITTHAEPVIQFPIDSNIFQNINFS
jgi:hypothetical protein